MMASTSRMCCKNLFPRPSPFEAPRTSPAMSTNSIAAGTIFSVFTSRARGGRRASGTVTTPTFGSIVQKG